jgi:hypothetical protein
MGIEMSLATQSAFTNGISLRCRPIRLPRSQTKLGQPIGLYRQAMRIECTQ